VCGRPATAQEGDLVTTSGEARCELVDQQLRAACLGAGNVPPRHDHHAAARPALPLTAPRALMSWGKEGPIDLHA
jgi:hypothetical protein